MSTVTIGRVRPYYRGNWSAFTAYTVMDRVTHDGHLYECIADSTNNEPVVSGSAYWLAISVNGETPEPVWDGTKLSWEYPDGTTTEEVDLQGPKGDKGDKGDPATPLTSDLTSTATDVGLTALGGNRLYNLISDTRTIVVSNPTASITHAPIGHSVSFTTSASSLLVPAQDIVKFYLSVPEIQISNTVFNATNDAATISFTTPAGVVEGTTLTVQLVAEDAVGNKSRVASTSVTAVQGKVKAPTITVPVANSNVATNAVGVTITGSAFDTQYVSDTHARSRFSICTDSTAQNVVAQYHSNAPELTHTFLVSELDEITVDDTPLYAFLRYEGTNLGWGELSDPQPFVAHFASVDKPTISAPTANATVVTNLDGLTVTTGSFSTTGAQDTQAGFKIRITSDIGGNAVVAEKTVNSAVTTYTMTTAECAALNNGTVYVWAAHVGTTLGQSAWSDPVAVTVAKATIATPSVVTPTSNANVVYSGGVTITLSSFAVTGAGTNTDTQASASYKITSDAAGENVVAQSLANTTDLTSHTFAAADVSSMVDGTTYYAWGKQAGTALGDSAWSTAVAFVAKAGITTASGRLIYRHSNDKGSVIEFDMFGRPVKLFVADAQYRKTLLFGGFQGDTLLTNFNQKNKEEGYYINGTTSINNNANIPVMTDAQLQSMWGADSGKTPNLSSDMTARENCNILMTFSEVNATDKAIYYTRSLNSFSGITDGCDVPNEYELMVIFIESSYIDSIDPTVSLYPSYSLGDNSPNGYRWNFDTQRRAFSCTKNDDSTVRHVNYDGNCYALYTAGSPQYCGVIPIREL